MEEIKLTIFEIEGLLKFLTKYVNKDTLSSFEEPFSQEPFSQHLFLAFIKLQKAKEKWYESMQPSD